MTTIGNTQSFDAIFDDMRNHGMKLPAEKIFIRIPEAKRRLSDMMAYILKKQGKNAVWLEAYDHVADWLEDNKGRGLFLYGNCGLGKSLLCRYAIPAIILQHLRKVVTVYDIQDLARRPDEVITKKILSLDDIGTEETSVQYGNRRDIFPEVMDSAEKQGKLVIISTNMNESALKERYGDRTLDRIKAVTTRVLFRGKSLRG